MCKAVGQGSVLLSLYLVASPMGTFVYNGHNGGIETRGRPLRGSWMPRFVGGRSHSRWWEVAVIVVFIVIVIIVLQLTNTVDLFGIG